MTVDIFRPVLGIGRITDALERRYPRAYTAICIVSVLAALVGFVAWDAERVHASPIRGTSEWTAGLVLGGGSGVIAALAWMWLAWTWGPNLADRRWQPWQWASSVVLIIALATAHTEGDEQPRVVTAYSVGALSYVITSFAGILLVLGLVLVRRHTRRRHP